MSNTNKVQVDVDALTGNWWFVYSDEIETIEQLNAMCDMDDVFHLIRVMYISYIPVVISDWKLEDGDLWITFAKKE